PRLAADPASTAAPSGPGRGEAALAPRERRPWRGGVPRRRRFGRIPPAPTRRLGADHDRARRNPLRHRPRPRRPRRRHHPRLALGPAQLDPRLRLPRHRHRLSGRAARTRSRSSGGRGGEEFLAADGSVESLQRRPGGWVPITIGLAGILFGTVSALGAPAAAIILVSLSARRSWTLDFVCLATAIASQAA